MATVRCGAMPRPYSADLRGRVLRACKAATRPRAELARQFEVGESTLYLWLQQEGTEGRCEAKPHAGGHTPHFDGGLLEALLAERNDRTLAELAAAYQARTGPPISPSSVRRVLAARGVTRTKKGAPRD